jgi:PAS domain S-box-containing protein
VDHGSCARDVLRQHQRNGPDCWTNAARREGDRDRHPAESRCDHACEGERGERALASKRSRRLCVGHHVHETIHHSHADGSAYPISECPMYLTYASGTDHHIADEMLWRKDGSSFPVEYTSTPIKKNGQVVGAVVTFMDITERKKAEEEAEHAAIQFRQKEAQFSATINSMFGGIFMVDKDLNFIAANEQIFKLYDFPKELGKKGMPLSNFLHMRAKRGEYGPGDPDELLAKHLEMYKDPTQTKKVVKYEDKLPGNRTAEVYRAPMEDGGFVFVFNDITARKRTEEELRQNMEDLERFSKLVVGREERMVEIKNEVNELLRGLGQQDKYKIVA